MYSMNMICKMYTMYFEKFRGQMWWLKSLVLAYKWNVWNTCIKFITKSDQPWYAFAYLNNLFHCIAGKTNATFHSQYLRWSVPFDCSSKHLLQTGTCLTLTFCWIINTYNILPFKKGCLNFLIYLLDPNKLLAMNLNGQYNYSSNL